VFSRGGGRRGITPTSRCLYYRAYMYLLHVNSLIGEIRDDKSRSLGRLAKNGVSPALRADAAIVCTLFPGHARMSDSVDGRALTVLNME